MHSTGHRILSHWNEFASTYFVYHSTFFLVGVSSPFFFLHKRQFLLFVQIWPPFLFIWVENVIVELVAAAPLTGKGRFLPPHKHCHRSHHARLWEDHLLYWWSLLFRMYIVSRHTIVSLWSFQVANGEALSNFAKSKWESFGAFQGLLGNHIIRKWNRVSVLSYTKRSI